MSRIIKYDLHYFYLYLRDVYFMSKGASKAPIAPPKGMAPNRKPLNVG